MSTEAPKPVEEPVVAPVEAPVEAVPEAAPAEAVEPVVDAPAAAEPAKEEAKAEEAAPVKEEVKPVEEGVLGYKGTGLLKSFIFQKKFFWFGTEPVEQKALASYLRGEKAQDVANVNVAWASETGKGLLFFSKKASEKATPAGIFNLSEVSDITEEGTIAFHFTIGGHKHTFEAITLGERDNWVAQLKAKAAEAKELAPTVTESEKYKESHAALTKPVVAAVAPKKSVEKVEEKKEETATPAIVEPPKEEKKEEKKARKSRSASRKRTSIFGNFGLGKKEEKVESPKDESAPAAEAAPIEAAVVPETTEAAPVEPVVAEATPASPTEEKKEERPAASKRNSIFGTLQSKFSSHKEKKPEAEAPAVPAKDAEPVSENAPVIPAVEASEPLATEVTPAAPVEATEAPVTNGETKAEEKPTTKSDKRKSSLPWLNKKDKSTPTSDEEADKPKSPFAKLRATVRGKKAEKTEEKPAEAAAPAETPAEAAPVAAAEPAVEPAPVVPATTPQVVASA